MHSTPAGPPETDMAGLGRAGLVDRPSGRGPLAWLRARRAQRHREALEDALKHLFAAQERGRVASLESLAGALGVSTSRAADLAGELHAYGLATTRQGFELTVAGERLARSIVRAHRLWERYLADVTRAAPHSLHRRADVEEHRLTVEQVERLAARLGHPLRDPHGDPIPARSGGMAVEADVLLTLLEPGSGGEISHVEDEPEVVYQRLAEQGFEPGRSIIVRAREPDRIVVELDGDPRVLSPVDAVNVFVSPRALTAPRPGRTLADLAQGETGTVGALRVTGFARQRLLDLGFTPGAEVVCDLISPFGEPTAYRVRGTLIALRPEEAGRIDLAEPESEGR
jgi:DtxR family Mn-dependent transcriptional regulator